MKFRKILVFILPILFLLPIFVFAAGLLSPRCTGSTPELCDFTAVADTINRVIVWIRNMAGVIASITFAIAGGKMLLNPDDPGKRSEAISMMKKTFIGLIIVLGAWLVITTVIKHFVIADTDALRFFKIINN